jgi:hypothetical protein
MKTGITTITVMPMITNTTTMMATPMTTARVRRMPMHPV